VLYKLGRDGCGEEVALEDLPRCPGLSLVGFTAEMFLQACILAGCDFLAGLQGIGLKKAVAALRKYKGFIKVGGGGHILNSPIDWDHARQSVEDRGVSTPPHIGNRLIYERNVRPGVLLMLSHGCMDSKQICQKCDEQPDEGVLNCK
jgi:hypothetical protein